MQRPWKYGIAVLAVTLIGMPASVAQSASQGSQTTPKQSAGKQPSDAGSTATASVEKIADSPAQWYGKKVTIKARVGDVFSRKVFNVEEEGMIDVDDEVLIVAPKHTTYLNADQIVTVTGTVHAFVRTDIERKFDGLDWDLAPELLLQFEKRPVIVADVVTAGKIAGKR